MRDTSTGITTTNSGGSSDSKVSEDYSRNNTDGMVKRSDEVINIGDISSDEMRAKDSMDKNGKVPNTIQASERICVLKKDENSDQQDNRPILSPKSAMESSQSLWGYVYEVMVLQFGCQRFKLFCLEPLVPGQVVQCHIHRRNINPISQLLLPKDLSLEQIPRIIATQLITTVADKYPSVGISTGKATNSISGENSVYDNNINEGGMN